MVKIFSEYHSLYSNPSPKLIGNNVGKILLGIFLLAVSAYAVSGLLHYYQMASVSHFNVLTSVLGPLGFRATFWTAAAAGFVLGLGLVVHGSVEIHRYRNFLERRKDAHQFLNGEDDFEEQAAKKTEDKEAKIQKIREKRDSEDSKNAKTWECFLGANMNEWQEYKDEYSKVKPQHYKVFNVSGKRGAYFIVFNAGVDLKDGTRTDEFRGTLTLTKSARDELVEFLKIYSDYEPMTGGTEEKGSS